MHWVYLMIATVGEVLGTTALNQSNGFTRLWPSLLTILSYSVAFYCLSLSLKTLSVGIAYAIWAGVGIVLVALIGWIGFKQSLDTPALIGLGLIISGVVVINTLSTSVQH